MAGYQATGINCKEREKNIAQLFSLVLQYTELTGWSARGWDLGTKNRHNQHILQSTPITDKTQ